MLELYQHNNRLMNNAGNDLTRYDYNFFNNSRLRNVGLPRNKYLGHACIPFLMNGIEVQQASYMFDPSYTDPDYLEPIINNLKNTAIAETDKYNILRCFVPEDSIDTFCALMGDAYTEVPDAIKTLYNTCTKQTEIRNLIPFTCAIRVFTSKINHTLCMVLNYDDKQQGSEMFLTIGLTPILFEDYKEKFCEEEMKYFNALVKRSQVRRISNVAVSNAFIEMNNCEKYTNLLRTETTKIIINNILNTRMAASQREIDRTEETAKRMLDSYNEALKKYYKLQKDMQRLTDHKDEELEAVKTALSIPTIYKLDQSRMSPLGIEITLKTTCSFYELDEVECVMHNINKDTVFYKFIKDIFIDQKYKLYFGHIFTFSFDSNDDFNPSNITDWTDLKEMDCLCNPHLFRFSCFGDYKPRLIEAMRQQDLTMFINIAIASLKSINFRDGAVIRHWKELFEDMEEQWNSGSGTYRNMATAKCLEDEQGNKLSIADVYLKPEEVIDAPTIEPRDTVEVV